MVGVHVRGTDHLYCHPCGVPKSNLFHVFLHKSVIHNDKLAGSAPPKMQNFLSFHFVDIFLTKTKSVQ